MTVHLVIYDVDPTTGARSIKNVKEQEVYFGEIPLQTADGAVVIAAIRDATERRRIERVLQEKNAELERVNAVKDQGKPQL